MSEKQITEETLKGREGGSPNSGRRAFQVEKGVNTRGTSGQCKAFGLSLTKEQGATRNAWPDYNLEDLEGSIG